MNSQKKFFEACRKNNITEVKNLLDKKFNKPNINKADSTNTVPLFIALENESSENIYDLVKVLIEEGADINIFRKDGHTPLTYILNERLTSAFIKAASLFQDGEKHKANLVIEDEVTLIRHFIKSGANLNEKNKLGETPLTSIFSAGYLINFIIDSDDNPIKPLTKLMKIIDILINNGADVNKANSVGKTIFDITCEKSYDKFIKFILDRGGKINSHILSDQGMCTLITGLSLEQLENAIENGDIKDLNVRDKFGYPVLWYICEKGEMDKAKLIVKHGGNLNIEIEGNSMLIHAIKYPDYNKYIKYFIELGMDINKENSDGETAFYIAIKGLKYFTDVPYQMKERLKIIELLENSGGNLDNLIIEGKTASKYLDEIRKKYSI